MATRASVAFGAFSVPLLSDGEAVRLEQLPNTYLERECCNPVAVSTRK